MSEDFPNTGQNNPQVTWNVLELHLVFISCRKYYIEKRWNRRMNPKTSVGFNKTFKQKLEGKKRGKLCM